MSFKSITWYRIAIALSVINLVALGFALRPTESLWHAAAHGVLALAFLGWSQRLRSRVESPELPAELEAFAIELNEMRQQLSETQERLDFVERMLAQEPEARRVGRQPE
jgi:hypothetical protein